jgi:hypothetical protein
MRIDIIPTTSFTFVKLVMTVGIILVQLITRSHKPSENRSGAGFVNR